MAKNKKRKQRKNKYKPTPYINDFAQLIKNKPEFGKPIPASLYKYREYNEHFTPETLQNSLMLFSTPNCFDDDNDALIRANPDTGTDDFIRFIKLHVGEFAYNSIEPRGLNHATKNNVSLYKIRAAQKKISKTADEYDPPTIKKSFTQVLSRADDATKNYFLNTIDKYRVETEKTSLKLEIEESIRNIALFHRNNMMVSCLCESNNNDTMWEQYADRNAGLVIEYDVQNLALVFGTTRLPLHILPISYRDNFDTYRLIDQLEAWFSSEIIKNKNDVAITKFKTFITEQLFVKTSTYAYEKEWRVVIPKLFWEKRVNIIVPIKNIYLGTKFSKENEETVLSIAKEKGYGVYRRKHNISGTYSFEKVDLSHSSYGTSQ